VIQQTQINDIAGGDQPIQFEPRPYTDKFPREIRVHLTPEIALFSGFRLFSF
jgi:hypothetical protein